MCAIRNFNINNIESGIYVAGVYIGGLGIKSG